MASRSSRYINQDIYQYIDVKKDFPEYEGYKWKRVAAGNQEAIKGGRMP